MRFRTLSLCMLLLLVAPVPAIAQASADPPSRAPVLTPARDPAPMRIPGLFGQDVPNRASSTNRERAERAALAERQRAAQAEREQQARGRRLAETKAKLETEVLQRAERAATRERSEEARRRAAAAEQANAVTQMIGKARADFVEISRGADTVLAQGSDINPVAAMNRMRSLYGRLENLHDRMAVLRRSMPDGDRQLAQAEGYLAHLFGKMQELRERLNGIANRLEDEADKALAENRFDEAMAKLREAAANDPDPKRLVRRIVDIHQQRDLKVGRIWVRGSMVDANPILKDGRNLVPLRALAEALDAEVSWDAETRTVTFVKGDNTVKVTIDKNVVTVNGNQQTIDVPATIIDGRTFVPLRAVAELLAAEVDYDAATGAVSVSEPVPAAAPPAEASGSGAAGTP